MGRQFEHPGTQAIYDKFVGHDPDLVDHYERTLAAMEIGVAIRRLREEAGLTMKELARRIGTQPSAIARLEHADYEGHSLSMLRKVAAALGHRVEVRFPRVEVRGAASGRSAAAKPTSAARAASPKESPKGKKVRS